MEVASATAALEHAADAAAGLAPGAGDGRAFDDHVGLQPELVGVAGAGQDQRHARACHAVDRPAADTFNRSIFERNSAATAPYPGKAAEGAGIGAPWRGRHACR